MKRFLPVLLLLLLAACGRDESGPGIIAIAGARLEPGGGKPAIPYSIVIIEGDKIKTVGEQADVPLSKDGVRVDGREQVITPLDPNGVIEPGKPANLSMKGPAGAVRIMREGKWQQ